MATKKATTGSKPTATAHAGGERKTPTSLPDSVVRHISDEQDRVYDVMALLEGALALAHKDEDVDIRRILRSTLVVLDGITNALDSEVLRRTANRTENGNV